MPSRKKSSRSSARASRGEIDAISLLSADHRTVEKLFKQYKKANGTAAKRALAKQICNELTVHTLLEEEIFYPACRKEGVEADDLDEAQVEHDTAKILIADLKAQSPKDDFYDAKMTVLSEYIKHHVSEEEQPRVGVFSQARGAGLDLAALGKHMQERKAQLTEQATTDQLGKPELQALDIENVS